MIRPGGDGNGTRSVWRLSGEEWGMHCMLASGVCTIGWVSKGLGMTLIGRRKWDERGKIGQSCFV